MFGKLLFAMVIGGVALSTAHAEQAAPLVPSIADACAKDEVSGIGQWVYPSKSYFVTTTYFDQDNKPVLGPVSIMGTMGTMGSGKVSKYSHIRETYFAVQKPGKLVAEPACTGYSVAYLVTPTDEASSATVRLSFEVARLPTQMIDGRGELPILQAVPVPSSFKLDKTITMKSGDVTSIPVEGDPVIKRVEVRLGVIAF